MPKIYPENLTYREYNEWALAAATMDTEKMFPILAKLLKISEDDLWDMGVEDALTLVRQAQESVNAWIENFDDSNITVHLSQWNMRDYNAFTQAFRNKNMDYVLKRLPNVLRKDGEPVEQPLTMEVGVFGMMKVRQTVQRILEGKD